MMLQPLLAECAHDAAAPTPLAQPAPALLHSQLLQDATPAVPGILAICTCNGPQDRAGARWHKAFSNHRRITEHRCPIPANCVLLATTTCSSVTATFLQCPAAQLGGQFGELPMTGCMHGG